MVRQINRDNDSSNGAGYYDSVTGEVVKREKSAAELVRLKVTLIEKVFRGIARLAGFRLLSRPVLLHMKSRRTYGGVTNGASRKRDC